MNIKPNQLWFSTKAGCGIFIMFQHEDGWYGVNRVPAEGLVPLYGSRVSLERLESEITEHGAVLVETVEQWDSLTKAVAK